MLGGSQEQGPVTGLMQEFKSEKGVLGFQQSGFPDGLEGTCRKEVSTPRSVLNKRNAIAVYRDRGGSGAASLTAPIFA